jgi:hypothetical protein
MYYEHTRIGCRDDYGVERDAEATVSDENVGHYEVVVDGDSVFGIAALYRLDGSGIESRWSRDFPALGPTQPLAQWVLDFFSRGVTLTTHLYLAPRLKKE